MKKLRTAGTVLVFTYLLLGVGSGCQGPPEPLRTVKYDRPYWPIPIVSGGRAGANTLIQFVMKTNPQVNFKRLNTLAHEYIEEAAAEGINSDVAFCQMVHETNYLRFGGDVELWQNNFCGLGATGGGEPGCSFATIEMGVRAHIQHLKAYANARQLRRKLVDPRFHKVSRATAPYVQDLTGKWATDPQYGDKIRSKLKQLEEYL